MTFRQSQEEPNGSLEVHAFLTSFKELTHFFRCLISFPFLSVPIFTAGVSSVFWGMSQHQRLKNKKTKVTPQPVQCIKGRYSESLQLHQYIVSTSQEFKHTNEMYFNSSFP